MPLHQTGKPSFLAQAITLSEYGVFKPDNAFLLYLGITIESHQSHLHRTAKPFSPDQMIKQSEYGTVPLDIVYTFAKAIVA